MIALVSLAVLALAVAGLAVHWKNRKPRGARPPRVRHDYCTKHQIVAGWAGGPDRLVWVYGPHRTPGNACDGAEHRRSLGIMP